MAGESARLAGSTTGCDQGFGGWWGGGGGQGGGALKDLTDSGMIQVSILER